MNLEINECLTNGFIANLKANNKIAAFILGALDSGFVVKMPGCITAKRSKLEVIANTAGDTKKVTFWKGSELVLEKPLSDFFWYMIDIHKGKVYYNKEFICKTT